MFVLDTNVLSAMMGRSPAPEVAAWIGAYPEEMLFTAAICQAEILAGVAVMPSGSRRAVLEAAVQGMFREDFAGRVLPFDTHAALVYGDLFAMRRRAGRPATTMDLMIAAIAQANGASVVTRDIGGFEGCGLEVINPWAMPG